MRMFKRYKYQLRILFDLTSNSYLGKIAQCKVDTCLEFVFMSRSAIITGWTFDKGLLP